MWLLLATGLCGGFTTFSTFSLEVVEAFRANRPDTAALYAGASLFCGVGGFALAYFAAEWLVK